MVTLWLSEFQRKIVYQKLQWQQYHLLVNSNPCYGFHCTYIPNFFPAFSFAWEKYFGLDPHIKSYTFWAPSMSIDTLVLWLWISTRYHSLSLKRGCDSDMHETFNSLFLQPLGQEGLHFIPASYCLWRLHGPLTLTSSTVLSSDSVLLHFMLFLPLSDLFHHIYTWMSSELNLLFIISNISILLSKFTYLFYFATFCFCLSYDYFYQHLKERRTACKFEQRGQKM